MRLEFSNYNNISYESKLTIAKQILKECYWNNTKYSPEDIIQKCEDKFFAKCIFSAIFQNSRNMFEALRLIKLEWVIEFIENQRIGNFRREDFTRRKDILINLFIDENHTIKGFEWKI